MLSAHYQPEFPYWPETLDQDSAPMSSTRHLLAPSGPTEVGGVPAWFWWPVRCGPNPERDGIARAALRETGGHWAVHASAIAAAVERRAQDDKRARATLEALGTLTGLLWGAASLPTGVAANGDGSFQAVSEIAGDVHTRRSRRVGTAARHLAEPWSSASLADDCFLQLGILLPNLGPLVLAVDNAESADIGTMRLCQRLLGSSLPVLVLATGEADLLEVDQRPNEHGFMSMALPFEKRGPISSLSPLTSTELWELGDEAVRLLAPRIPVAQDELKAIAVSAKGNPLVSVVASELLALGDLLPPASDSGTLLELDFARRWRTLDHDVQRALAAAAMQGTTFVLELIESVTGAEGARTEETLQQAAAHGWVVPLDPLRWAFSDRAAASCAEESAELVLGDLKQAGARMAAGALAYRNHGFGDLPTAVQEQVLGAYLRAARFAGWPAELDQPAIADELAGLDAVDGDQQRAMEHSRIAVEMLERLVRSGGGVKPSLALSWRGRYSYVLAQGHDRVGAIASARKLAEETAHRYGDISPETALAVWHLSLSHWRFNQLRPAGRVLDQALDIYDRSLHVLDDGAALRMRAHRARIAHERGALRGAETLLGKLLLDQGRVLGPENVHTLETRGNLARVIKDSGRLQAALASYQELLFDQERLLGADHERTLDTRVEIAGVLQERGHLDDALRAYEDALSEEERLFGSSDPRPLAVRSKRAGVLRAMGRLQDALDAYEDVVGEKRWVLNPEPAEALATRSSLAGVLREMGRLGEALAAYERILADQERALGGDHPRILATRGDLARVLQEMGQLSDALTGYEAVLADQERVLGPDHPATLTTRTQVAGVLQEMGQLSDALTGYEAVLADQERVLGPDHPATLTTRTQVAGVLQEMGQLSDALTGYEAVLADQERVLDAAHPAILVTCNNLAGILASLGQPDEAIAAYEAVLREERRSLGPDNPATLATRTRLAGVLGSIGRSRGGPIVLRGRPRRPAAGPRPGTSKHRGDKEGAGRHARRRRLHRLPRRSLTESNGGIRGMRVCLVLAGRSFISHGAFNVYLRFKALPTFRQLAHLRTPVVQGTPPAVCVDPTDSGEP